MHRTLTDLGRIADAVELGGSPRILVSGEVIPIAGADGDTTAGRTSLATALYRHLYCRPQAAVRARGGDARGVRMLIEQLSEANCGRGSWEAGWVVTAIEEDGTLRLQRLHDELAIWVPRERYRPVGDDVVVGGAGRMAVGKEYREMLPGFYMALGDADSVDEGQGRALVRFYWHLTAAAAPAWIAAISGHLNARGIPFRAKALSDPAAYGRADAGVLYVAREQMAATLEVLPDIYRVLARHLRRATPMFTRPLARGLGFAEDPGDGRSFGQHRCELVADALIRICATREVTKRAVTRGITERFAEEGLDARSPWLNAGSEEWGSWPAFR